MKNKLIYVIIFLFVILIGITIYKYKVYDKNEKKHYFIPMMPSNMRSPRVKVTSNVKEEEKDKILYKEYIITDDLKEIEYTYIVNNDESITGKIYIDDNKNLYITDIVNKKIYKPSDYKFKTLHKRENDYNEVNVYLISEDNNLFLLTLSSSEIKTSKVKPIFESKKVYNFVNLSYKSDIYKNGSSLFVLADDGNIYDVKTEIRYNSDIISMYDKFYVLKDKTMIDMWGRTYVDSNKNPYKIKYVFSATKNKIIDKETIMIITSDNKLLYIIYGDNNVHEFNKKIKDVKFDGNKIARKSKLKIIFENDYKIEFDAACNKYFCINEIEE